MKPNCNCIKEHNQKLSEKTGKYCDINIELISGCVLIDYFWDEKTRAGNIKQKQGYIMPSYCPFCGTAYLRDGVVKDG